MLPMIRIILLDSFLLCWQLHRFMYSRTVNITLMSIIQLAVYSVGDYVYDAGYNQTIWGEFLVKNICFLMQLVVTLTPYGPKHAG